MFTIKIGKIPGTMTEVVSDVPKTVAELADLADIYDLEGYTARINGTTGTLETLVSADAQVVFVKNAKGN